MKITYLVKLDLKSNVFSISLYGLLWGKILYNKYLRRDKCRQPAFQEWEIRLVCAQYVLSFCWFDQLVMTTLIWSCFP